MHKNPNFLNQILKYVELNKLEVEQISETKIPEFLIKELSIENKENEVELKRKQAEEEELKRKLRLNPFTISKLNRNVEEEKLKRIQTEE